MDDGNQEGDDMSSSLRAGHEAQERVDEPIRSDQPNGEWYAVKDGGHWLLLDCEGCTMLHLLRQPTPQSVGDMECAYDLGRQDGIAEGRSRAQRAICMALGL